MNEIQTFTEYSISGPDVTLNTPADLTRAAHPAAKAARTRRESVLPYRQSIVNHGWLL